MIHQGDRAVGCVHGADDAHIFRYPEKSAINREGDGLVPILQKVHQLSEDAREIGAIDLVDDEDANVISVLGLLAEFKEPAGNNGIFQRAVRAGLGPDSLNEIFVSIRRVELNQLYKSISAADQVAGEVFGQEGLAGAGWAKYDGLAFAMDRLKPTNQGHLTYSCILGKFVERIIKSRNYCFIIIKYKIKIIKDAFIFWIFCHSNLIQSVPVGYWYPKAPSLKIYGISTPLSEKSIIFSKIFYIYWIFKRI